MVTGSAVTLDGSTSSDANGDPLAYAWTLTSKPAGSAAALAGGTSARPTFTADAAGTYVASLVVNDGKVSSTSAAVVVNASAPAPVSVTLYLFGGSNHDLYIGCLTCNSFHLESVCNQFGSYGSQFASLSIWNQFGLYGSQFATSSPWNQFSSGGPKIIGSDNLFYGYFTTNQFQFSRTTIPAFLNVLNHFSRTADLSATRIFTCGN